MELYQYQKDGADWLDSVDKGLLFDEMGLGKTVQAIKALEGRDNPVIIICPAFLRLNWKDEFEKWESKYKIKVITSKKNFTLPNKGEAIIISYSGIPADIGRRKVLDNTIIIADECHAVKNFRAARTKRFRLIRRKALHKNGKVWGMTGTPLLTKPLDLWGMLKSLDLNNDAFVSFENFIRLFRGRPGRWGGFEFGEPMLEAAACLSKVGLGRSRSRVLPDLPNKTRRSMSVSIDKTTKKICDELLNDLQKAGVDFKSLNQAQMVQAMSLRFENIARVKAAVATSKIPHMLDFIKWYEETGTPLVVFSDHVAPVKALQGREGWAVITGDTPMKQRKFFVDMFQSGAYKGIAGTIGAMGTGVTLTKSSHMLFVDFNWTPALVRQAEDRICRIGQTKACQYTSLVADHPMDRLINKALTKKMSYIERSVESAYTD